MIPELKNKYFADFAWRVMLAMEENMENDNGVLPVEVRDLRESIDRLNDSQALDNAALATVFSCIYKVRMRLACER